MKFDYGDSVQIAATSRRATVVGITAVESNQQAEAFNIPLGTILYTVEFADGSDALVAEVNLKVFAPGCGHSRPEE